MPPELPDETYQYRLKLKRNGIEPSTDPSHYPFAFIHMYKRPSFFVFFLWTLHQL